jgi:hypothetical protein
MDDLEREFERFRDRDRAIRSLVDYYYRNGMYGRLWVLLCLEKLLEQKGQE